MDNLIAELEAATEESRALDADIHCAITGRIQHKLMRAGFTMEDQGDKAKNRHRATSKFIFSERGPAPRYTTSLDAAITLVPEGWGWAAAILDKDAPSAVVTNFEPQMKPGTFDPNPDKIDCRSKAVTPALALCIASLKARQTMKDAA